VSPLTLNAMSWSQWPQAQKAPKAVPPARSPWANQSNQAAVGLRRKEEEMKHRQEELKARREKEEQKRQQHAAAFVVRKVIHRLRVVDPEHFDELCAELDRTQAEQLDAMGPLAESVQQEAEKALGQASERFEKYLAEQAAEEKKRRDKEEQVTLETARLERLAKEAAKAVEDAGKEVDSAKVESKPIAEDAKESSPEDMLKAAAATESAVAAAKVSLDEASAEVSSKRSECVQSTVPAAAKVGLEFAELPKRIAEHRKDLDAIRKTVRIAKEKAARKAAALKKEQGQRDQFARHDTDGDGELDYSEVVAFANTEYGFELSEDQTVKILRTLAGPSGGVPFEKFGRLRSLVGIEKSCSKAREKRAEEEAVKRAKEEEETKRREVREEKQAEIMKIVGQANELLEEAETIAVTVRKSAQNLLLGAGVAAAGAGEAASTELPAAKLVEAATEVEAEVLPAKEKLEAADAHAKTIEADVKCDGDAELKAFQTKQLEALQLRNGKIRTTLNRVAASARETKERSARKMYTQGEPLRMKVVAVVQEAMSSEGRTGKQIFEGACSKGKVTREEFIAFIKSLAGRVAPEVLPEALRQDVLDEKESEKLFAHCASGGEEMDEEAFVRMLTRQFYRVSGALVLTDNESLQSKVICRLEVGDTLEALGAATKDASAGLERVRCRSVKDHKEGWATIVGNQGTVYLKPCGHFLACVKEAVMTSELSVADSKTIRRISKGEILEVLEFERKDASCGVMRVKGRAVRDGAVGWISTAGNQGTLFLEPC